MSLILCRQEPVKIPFYIEDLGIDRKSTRLNSSHIPILPRSSAM